MRGVRGRNALAVGALVAAMLLPAIAYWRIGQRRISYDRVYRIGFNQNPPFQMLTKDGSAEGFAVETVAAAARRSGIKLQWVFDASLSDNSLRDGLVDLWPLLADLPERHKYAYISDPYIISDNYLISGGPVRGLPPAGFEGIIHYSGPALYKILMRKRWAGVHFGFVPDAAQLVPSFCTGEYPLLFLSSHQANNFLRDISRACPEKE